MTELRRALLALLLALLPSVAPAANIADELGAVERIRGLRFLAPVKTVEIDRRDLPAYLREQFAKSLPYSIPEWGDVLRALHLVGAESDEAVVSTLLDLYQSQVLAYYDPPSRTFYTVKQLPEALNGVPMTGVLGDGVIVHELTHALQDQHFHIGRTDEALRDDADASLAFHALVEGEASLVMLAYMLEQSGASLDDLVNNDLLSGALAAATSQNIGVQGPPYFVEMMKFPYIDGLRFVMEAYRRGGWKALDRVYADPPLSTREILHPADYFDHRFKPRPFTPTPALPVPHLLSVEHLGEWHWRFLAGSGDGWVSDRVTIAQNRFCEPTVLVDTKWDSEEHARRFADGYTRFLEAAGVGSLSQVNGTSVRVAYGADRPLMDRFLAR